LLEGSIPRRPASRRALFRLAAWRQGLARHAHGSHAGARGLRRRDDLLLGPGREARGVPVRGKPERHQPRHVQPAVDLRTRCALLKGTSSGCWRAAPSGRGRRCAR
jgi:hypothetical protein